MKKRTQSQLDFDYAKHGWAFCNREMLIGKVERLRELVKALNLNDERHEQLATIETYLAQRTNESKRG
jgi:hypothetical protein